MTVRSIVVVTAVMCSLGTDVHAGESCFVPMPKSITPGHGSMELGSRIVAATPELRPLAEVVVEEILLLTGKKLAVEEGGSSRPGDVWLEITPARKDGSGKGLKEDQSYLLEVNDTVRVRGGSYAAVAYGTVTLLQSLEAKDPTATLNRCVVKDEPSTAYRGLMVDVARKPHSIATLQRCIQLCRWYKIRYPPHWMADDGYSVINCSATPLYVVSGWRHPDLKVIHQWNHRRFDWVDSAWKTPIELPPSAPVLGAQMCSWDQAEDQELPSLRQRLAVVSERLWNPDFDNGFNDLSARLRVTDTKLTTLLE